MISVTILTKNSVQYLPEVLEALKTFPEVLVLDTGSTDATMDLARTYPNVRVEEEAFRGFGEMHNRAADLASHDWIFSVDSDEVLSSELLKEIQSLTLDSDTVYSVPRKNLFNGKFIRHCGWYPDHCLRLYHRGHTCWTPDKVHETLKTKGMRVERLKGALRHYSYGDLSDFLHKMQSYSSLFAEQRVGKVTSSPCKAVLHAWWTFFKTYFVKRGILDGYEGFVISVYNAQTAFWKYLKLYEKNRLKEKER